MNIKNSIKYSLFLFVAICTLNTVAFGMNKITLPCGHIIDKHRFIKNMEWWASHQDRGRLARASFERLTQSRIRCYKCGDYRAGFVVCGATDQMFSFYTEEFRIAIEMGEHPEKVEQLMQTFQQYLTRDQIAQILINVLCNNGLIYIVANNFFPIAAYLLFQAQEYLSNAQFRLLLTVQNPQYGCNVFSMAGTNNYFEMAEILASFAKKEGLFTRDELETVLADDPYFPAGPDQQMKAFVSQQIRQAQDLQK